MIARLLAAFALMVAFQSGAPDSASAQSSVRPPERVSPQPAEDPASTSRPPAGETPEQGREATGGAQTLDDILRRQRGEEVSNEARRANTGAAAPDEALSGQLGPLGVSSDSDLYRAMRFGTDEITVTAGGAPARVVMQTSGMEWLKWRRGPLLTWGAIAIGAILALLILFYLIRGRIRIEAGESGVSVKRFGGVERFGHWLLAVSFILLALTGLLLLAGRQYLIPLIGKDGFAAFAAASKWVHNNVGWAFMVALILIFVLWVARNLPSRTDLKWLAKGGGFFSKGTHPPARKFNAGQKIVFWLVVILGASISASGVSLLFPFDLPMFAKTFGWMNDAAALIGLSPGLPTDLAPHEEMQYAQLWHSIIAFAMIVVVLAHIYIGSLGMEGGFQAMGSGRVDRNWAREHHSLWYEDKVERGETRPAPGDGSQPTPAE